MSNYVLRKGFCLAVALCMSCCFLKAQAWELGVQSNSFSVSWRDNGAVDLAEDTGFNTDWRVNHLGTIFLHKDKGNRYLRFNLYSAFTNNYAQSFQDTGNYIAQRYNNFRFLSGCVSIEIGKKFSIGKKLRILLGGEIGIEQTLINRLVSRSAYSPGPGVGYSINTTKNPSSTSLMGRIVARADYLLGSRFRLGLAFNYGANLSYEHGLPELETISYLLDGTEDGFTRSENGSGNRSIYFGNTGLSRPLITLSFLLKKPE